MSRNEEHKRIQTNLTVEKDLKNNGQKMFEFYGPKFLNFNFQIFGDR